MVVNEIVIVCAHNGGAISVVSTDAKNVGTDVKTGCIQAEYGGRAHMLHKTNVPVVTYRYLKIGLEK